MFTGFLREIDCVGRIVVPMQLRKQLGLTETGSKVEMFCDGTQIILKKSINECIFCKSQSELIEFEGKFVCATCLEKLKSE